MANKYVHKFDSLSDIQNLPGSAGFGSYGGGVFLNADGTVRMIGGVPVGTVYYVNYATGLDTNDGRSPSTAFKTLAVGYAALTSGANDVLVIIGSGNTTNTVRVDAAFTWAKDACHLLGVCAPSFFSPRARIAPTGATTAFTPFFTISGNGCHFANIQWWHGFNTGGNSQINLVVTGSRNVFHRCHIAGMGDSTSAGHAGSRDLKLGGSGAGENVFEECVIGADTIARNAANAHIEFTGGAVRNIFLRCIFASQASNAGVLSVVGSAASCIDRFNYFIKCIWTNYGTTRTAVGTLAASPGGTLVFVDPALFNVTGFGSDATTRGAMLVMGPSGTAATTGISLAPTA